MPKLDVGEVTELHRSGHLRRAINAGSVVQSYAPANDGITSDAAASAESALSGYDCVSFYHSVIEKPRGTGHDSEAMHHRAFADVGQGTDAGAYRDEPTASRMRLVPDATYNDFRTPTIFQTC